MVKAILIGVSDYSQIDGCIDLPWCKNDIYAVENALMKGLNCNKKNIFLLGESNTVTISDINSAFDSTVSEGSDTLIFYFSGHGGRNILCLSDCLLSLQKLIDHIEKLNFKNKIIILDCCHAGDFTISQASQIDIDQMVSSFVGYGYAVLASCSSRETSGFHPTKELSLYTSFVCEALQFRPIIRKGKKSLEDIQNTVSCLAKMWNSKNNSKIQQPIFRENIGGTIYFDIEEYNPYQKQIVFEETDDYIIYEVEPSHISNIKRYAVKVILKNMYDRDKMSELSKEIVNKAKYYEVYSNKNSEVLNKGKLANIIWCYFAYDESDIINARYAFQTTWVDDYQDKNHWYRLSKNCFMVNDVHFTEFPYYNMLKRLTTTQISEDELINITKDMMIKLINESEIYIRIFREYQNGEMSELQFIEEVSPICEQIDILYRKQSNLPVAPDNLCDWAQANIEIACSIHDISLFYNKRYYEKWGSQNRELLMKNSIKRYERGLEKLCMLNI